MTTKTDKGLNMIEDLHVSYRPSVLEEVLGQDSVVNSLQQFKDKGNWPHAYLLVGPSGTGKTTIGRIIASEIGAGDIVELDAASKSSVEGVRNLTSSLQYKGFGESSKRVIILDEVHSFSKQAWQALLKSIEEPPEHIYFVLCTTEADKVPKTIKTRCHLYNLKSVGYEDLAALIEVVADSESIQLTTKMVNLLAKESEGSPRMALTNLSKARACQDIDELRDILESADENSDVIELCRLLMKSTVSWAQCIAIIKKLEAPQPESIRLTIIAYVSKVLINTKDEAKVVRMIEILDAFAEPFNPSEKLGPLFLALGTLVFGD